MDTDEDLGENMSNLNLKEKMMNNRGKIFDCPCDTCDLQAKCGRDATECRAVKNFYETAWFYPHQVKMNLKPMKMRKVA